MVDYTLTSYEEALKTYDKNIEDLKGHSSKEIDDLVEVFNKTQKDLQDDQFLSLSEKEYVLEKRQE
jgi:prefoldin subunit 5